MNDEISAPSPTVRYVAVYRDGDPIALATRLRVFVAGAAAR